MKESSLVNACRRYLESIGATTIKTHGSALYASEPDILGCYEGRFFAFECKIHPNKPTPKQTSRLKSWKKSGALVAVIYSVEECEEYLLKGKQYNV